MRHVSILILLIFSIIASLQSTAISAVKGGIEYSIPVDYSKLNKQEIELKARNYFYNADRLEDGILNEDITNALLCYKALENIDLNNIEYPLKLGILYDKIGKDRQAKGYFFKAIGIDAKNPLPYFYIGEFYYKRELYRKALRYYNESYKRGFNKDYNLLYKIGDIYEKLGDSRSALKYLYEAESNSTTPELNNKIKRIELQDAINKEFYSDTRIRK